MPFYFSNVITYPTVPLNSGEGDSLATAFLKLNQNFNTLSNIGNAEIRVVGITSSYISIFNQLEAATIRVQTIGNAGSNFSGNLFSGNTFTANVFTANTFTTNTITSTNYLGNIGTGGGNSAIVTTLTASGNVTVANLTVNGFATINSIALSSIDNTPIGVTTANVGRFTNLTATANATIEGNLNVTTIRSARFIVKDVNNSLTTNVPAAFTLALSPDSNIKQYTAATVNTNVTITYGTITSGCDRYFVFRNTNGTTRQIVLPNGFNNKASTTVVLSGNANVSMHFIPFDTTSSNVYVNITNT